MTAVKSALYAADNAAFSTNAIAIGITSSDLVGDLTYGISQGKRGTRQPSACRTRVTSETVLGGFDCNPVASEFDWILQRCLGNAIATFPAAAVTPGETLPPFYIAADKAGETTFLYSLLRFASLSISGAAQQELSLRADLLGSTETIITDLASPPVLDCATQFITADVIFQIGATQFSLRSFDLSIDNLIFDGQHENQLARTRFEAGGLAVTFSPQLVYRTDTKALYRRTVAGDDDLQLIISDGADTYTFEFGNMKAPAGAPTIPDDGDVLFNPVFMGMADGSDPAIKVTKS